MKKNQGFTLIELLAVVVILAVIALISVPLIMNVIDGARKGALQNTAYGIAEAGKYAFTSEVIKDGSASFTAYTYVDGVEASSPTGKTLNYKGERPKKGTILINSKGDIAMSVYNGKYCAEKGFDDVEVTVSEKAEADCVLVEELTEVEVLVVAGGGSGGSHTPGTSTAGSGGGAGGLIYNAGYTVIPGTAITISVGAGGVGTTAGGNVGANSVFGTLTALGGGRGTGQGYITNGNGGSGSGESYYSFAGGTSFGLGTPGQGNDGGTYNSSTNPPYPAGGGGGAGSKGGNGTATAAGAGGDGLYYGDKFGNTFGSNGWFSGGGGGGIGNTGIIANAGLGKAGGGNGGYDATSGTSAVANTGSGGGGGGKALTSGGNGGSGVIIVRYYGTQRANGGAVTTVGDYTVHTFASGTATFTPSDL